MTAYFIRRLLLIVPTFLGVTIVIFGITRIVPGGPLERQMMQLRMGANARGIGAGGGQIPKEAEEELKRQFDLDKPGYVAYLLWLKKLVTLDLGNSYIFREPVWNLISSRFPVSIYFGLIGFTLTYLVCIPLGIIKALRHSSWFDVTSSIIVFMGYSVPGWALGALLLVVFAGGGFFSFFPLGGFRSTGYDQLPGIVKSIEEYDEVFNEDGVFEWSRMSFAGKAIDQVWHTVLPVICYMISAFATLTVLTKNSLMENLGQDYVRTAFAKGLSPGRVIFLHTVRNSLIPLVTGLGSALGIFMAGSYLIEFVFNIDGIGLLGYTSLVGRDYTVVMGILSINTLLLLFGNLLSDLLYAIVDPRIRFT